MEGLRELSPLYESHSGSGLPKVWRAFKNFERLCYNMIVPQASSLEFVTEWSVSRNLKNVGKVHSYTSRTVMRVWRV